MAHGTFGLFCGPESGSMLEPLQFGTSGPESGAYIALVVSYYLTSGIAIQILGGRYNGMSEPCFMAHGTSGPESQGLT